MSAPQESLTDSENTPFSKTAAGSEGVKFFCQSISRIAHEVRNPLNAILSITEALFLEIGDNPSYKPFLEHIRAQVDRLSDLMHDVSEISKTTRPSVLQQQSLHSLCTAAVNAWDKNMLSLKHKVQLIFPSDCHNLSVMADSSGIRQALLNLFENAAQHSPGGSEIKFIALKPSKKFVQIRIVDAGTGIPAENLQKVFEPFFTTQKGQKGLGLSMARLILLSHGGDMIIYNNDPPPGCTVAVSLPVIQEGPY